MFDGWWRWYLLDKKGVNGFAMVGCKNGYRLFFFLYLCFCSVILRICLFRGNVFFFVLNGGCLYDLFWLMDLVNEIKLEEWKVFVY